MDSLDDLYGPEDLCPELADHLQESVHIPGTKVLHHPLIVIPLYHDMQNRMSNRMFAYKRQQLDAARAKGDYRLQINLHERPYRLEALWDLREVIEDPAEYWRCVRMVWIDTENAHECRGPWEDIWSEECPHRESVMTEEERASLAAMPERITVYRGYNDPSFEEGFSWTTNRTKGLWFAKRFRGAATLLTGTIARDEVRAYIEGRGEFEIVALPGAVEVTKKLRVR